ncbi:MAG: zinc ribbon domain-containing protein [Acidobacteria bacterium]|nr:zinc ribbon domain-containing protein [Acidobacteriota bacterium]
MPLFEYRCRGCGHGFEYLTRAGDAPACPSCASADLQKQFSSFAVSAGKPSSRPPATSLGGCGACGDPRGPGSCSIN